MTLGLALLAGVWATHYWAMGDVVRAVAGVAVLLGGHAWVLAVEFMLLRQFGHGDPTPRATLLQLFRAWCGEVSAIPLIFCWRQPFRSRRWPDLLPSNAQGRRGLLLVHGYVCNRGIWNRWLQRLTTQGVPFVAVDLEPVFGDIDDYIPIIESAVRRLEQCTGLPPVAVAHSMGGLAMRCWWDAQGAAQSGSGACARLHRLITIGTPHRGTWLARLAFTRNARQMRNHSGWLQALAQREPADRAARVSCFYSHCDNIVFPARAATLDGADNRHIEGVAHAHMLDRPDPYDEVRRWLRVERA